MFSGQSGDHLGTLAILDHFLVDLLANIVFIQVIFELQNLVTGTYHKWILAR